MGLWACGCFWIDSYISRSLPVEFSLHLYLCKYFEPFKMVVTLLSVIKGSWSGSSLSLSLYLLLWTINPLAVSAADCSGPAMGVLPGTWLAPVDLRQGVCGTGPKLVINCDGQPAEDCRQIVTNTAKNSDLLLRKQWIQGGRPRYSNCEGGVVRSSNFLTWCYLFIHIKL